MSKSKKKLYCYAVPDAMKEHLFTDDVAIVWAKSKKKALKKFEQLYANVCMANIKRVRFNSYGVAILTDY